MSRWMVMAGLLLAGMTPLAWGAPAVTESAREVPVAASADVVIVGGGSAAVSAAVAAAKSGAKVYVVAPRPYLGEDLCAPMRLWLEAGEKPLSELAMRLFMPEKAAAAGVVPGLPYTYTTSIPASDKHKDTNPPSKLFDGLASNAASESLQYDGDVTITASLGAPKDVAAARILLFDRADDFHAESVTVETSADGRAYKPLGTFKCDAADGDRVTVVAPINAKVQGVRMAFKRGGESKRLLLGEIIFMGPEAAKPAVTTGGDAPKDKAGPFRPMHIKKSLDDALLAAGVQYMYSSIATEVLRDAKGNIAGVVMTNRAGRQAVLAKVVIDATDRAWIARAAGGQFASFPAGTQEFSFVTVGGKAKNGDSFTSRGTGMVYPIAVPAKPPKKDPKKAPVTSAELIEYTVKLPMQDGSYASYAKAEQTIRDMAWDEEIQFLTDEIFQVPPDPMKGVKSAAAFEGPDKVDLDVFRPAGTSRLFVLGGCADMPREAAAKLVRPVNLIEVGQRIGAAAATEAKALPEPTSATIAGTPSSEKSAVQVKEMLTGLRPTQSIDKTVAGPGLALPVIGEYDVVVVGGGTGGAPAGISAARAKAKTLVLEYLHGLGGVGTTGMIATYYHGYRGGFTGEVPGTSWDPVQREEWWRSQLRKAGADIWFGVIGAGAVVNNGEIQGVIVTTPEKRGIVLAKIVIDATGNSDIAAAAGAQTIFHEPSEPAVQGTGLPPLGLGRYYVNTDFTIVDETDMMDVWHVLTYAKRKYPNAFDQGQLIDTRERRRIVGEFTMTLPDAINLRTYPDTVHIAASDFDTHGFTVDPYLMVEHPHKKRVIVNVPLRCLLAKGLERLIVIGLGVSAHRDVMPLLRMQPDIQNQGYAVGMIAAACAKSGKLVRQLDLKPIQEQLAELEIIPREALNATDSYPLPDERIAAAVASVKDQGKGMAVIITHPQKALPLLKQAFAAAATPADKLAYAKVLAVLGDSTGIDVMMAYVDPKPWDAGWNYKAMGQFGHALSEIDTLLVAMGRCKDKKVLPVVLKKVGELDASKEFSHHRAVALALEALGDPAAAGPLFDLLNKPGMMGHIISSVEDAGKATGTNTNDNNTRATSIRELSLARALYRCGDKDGLGKKILEQYTRDYRGHLAKHAQKVLAAK